MYSQINVMYIILNRFLNNLKYINMKNSTNNSANETITFQKVTNETITYVVIASFLFVLLIAGFIL